MKAYLIEHFSELQSCMPSEHMISAVFLWSDENLECWKIFDEKRQDCAKNLDMADIEFKTIKKNFNMERGPQELSDKLKIAATMRLEQISQCVGWQKEFISI